MYDGFYEDFQKACLQAEAPPQPKRIPHWREKVKGVNGYDPMSPYTLPESLPPLTNPADLMNKKGFMAYYPQSYTPIPNYFRDNNITPFFDPSTNDDESRGMLTIAGMVELLDMGQPFTICRDQDIDEIIFIAEHYLSHMSHLNDRQVAVYLPKVEKLLNHLKLASKKLANKHGGQTPIRPDLAEILKRIFGG